MSLIKISQYTQDTLPREIADGLMKLKPEALLPEPDASIHASHLNQASTKTTALTPDSPFPSTENTNYLTLSSNETLMGFAVFSTQEDTARIHSVFIKKAYRRKSLGKKLILHLLYKSVQSNCRKVTVTSTKESLDFFTGLGFIISASPSRTRHFETAQPETPSNQDYLLENPCPEYYLSAMKKSLIEKQKNKSANTSPLIISEDLTNYSFSSEKQYLALHRNMLSQAKRRIWLTSPSINAPVLRDEHFSHSILRLVKSNPQAEIRILLEDDKAGAGRFNPMINLAQRLTSFVEIRTLPPGAAKFKEMITLVDFSAGIYRKSMDSHIGFANYNNPMTAERLRDKFEKYWEFSNPSLETRRLTI